MRSAALASMLVGTLLLAAACGDEDLVSVETATPATPSPTTSIERPSAATANEEPSIALPTPAVGATASPGNLIGMDIEVWVYPSDAATTGACIDVLWALVPVTELDVVDAVVGRCTFDGRTFIRVTVARTATPGVLGLASIELLMLVQGPDPGDPCGGRLQPVLANADPGLANCLTVRRVVPHLPGAEPPAARLIPMALPETARDIEVPAGTHCWELMRLFDTSLEEASPVRARCLLD